MQYTADESGDVGERGEGQRRVGLIDAAKGVHMKSFGASAASPDRTKDPNKGTIRADYEIHVIHSVNFGRYDMLCNVLISFL